MVAAVDRLIVARDGRQKTPVANGVEHRAQLLHGDAHVRQGLLVGRTHSLQRLQKAGVSGQIDAQQPVIGEAADELQQIRSGAVEVHDP